MGPRQLLLLLLLGGAAVGRGRSPQQPMAPRRRREAPPPPPSPLRWEPFGGRLPADAVSSWNRHRNVTEFVCAAEVRGECQPGAYVPARGPFCYVPLGGYERPGPAGAFTLLVNAGGLAPLAWVAASFGAVPRGAVAACPGRQFFVGRGGGALGKVSREQRAAFAADSDGDELWYKWYEVLAVRDGPAEATLQDVTYDLAHAAERDEPATVAEVTARNEGCAVARQAVALEGTSEAEHDWQLEPPLDTGAGQLLAAPLLFTGAGWREGNVTAVPWAGGASTVRYVRHAAHVAAALPARSSCRVALAGRRRELALPFTARLLRRFPDGAVHRAHVAGRARSSLVTGVRGAVRQCRPLTGLPPCPG